MTTAVAPRRLVLAAMILLSAAPAAAAVDRRLGRTVTPLFESVRLTLDASQPDYTGSARVELQVNETIPSFRFHAQEMTLDRVALTGAGGRDIGVTHAAGDLGLVTLTAAEPLPPGHYTLAIDFSARFGIRQVGLYRVDQDGQSYVFSQFEADDARRAFPCWDEPSFKNPWQLTLVTPEAHMAVTNTPVDKETTAAGWRTTVFRKTPPLPSYLLAVAAGPLETVEIPGLSIPGRVVTVKGKKPLAAEAARTAPPLLAALEAWFGRPYPFEKLDLIAVPEYWPGAMENPGAITYAEALLLIDPASGGPAQRRHLARVTAHELAHMWFGDLVTMEWWDDLWLNESFADWLGDKITGQVFPAAQTDLSELQAVEATMSGDARLSTQAIRRRIDAGDNKLENVGTDYNKGKTILSMFEKWIGPETFRRGVLDYVAAHEWGTARGSDLWGAVSAAAGRDIGPAMESFLDQGGLPLVTVEPAPAGPGVGGGAGPGVGPGVGGGAGGGSGAKDFAGAAVRITQRRFANFGAQAPAQSWRIPVTLKYPVGGGARTLQLLLTQESQTVSLDLPSAPAWVLPDADAAGYYRWNVPPDMLRRLAAEAPAALTPRERIGFLGNLSALLDAGAIHGDAYLEALGHFASDPQPEVLDALLGSLEKVKVAFVPDEAKDAFARYVRSTLGPALQRAGLSPAPGEDESLTSFRPRLVEWLGAEGEDPAVLDRARAMARSYLADPKSVDPPMAGVALRLAARDGDKALFDDLRARLEGARTPQDRAIYLAALGSFRDPALAEEALAYALTGRLRPQEMFQLTGGLGRTAKGRDRLFRFMEENYATITSRIPPMFVGFMPFFASGCEPQRLDRARAFFADPTHQAAGTATTLAKVGEQVNDCAGLRAREGAAVSGWLGRGGGRP